tara:strand:- start:285 stop:590 length:306 start_codon:yes stop_codon:yes gene_type:complete
VKSVIKYRKSRLFVKDKTLDFILDTIASIIKGIANIIDGLILILSFGRFYSSLSFRVVMWIVRKSEHPSKQIQAEYDKSQRWSNRKNVEAQFDKMRKGDII